jgi:hypothetical protein
MAPVPETLSPAVDGVVPIALPTLQVSGVFIAKAQLLTVLQLFLPQLADIELVPGDRFLLHLGAAPEIGPTTPERRVP